MGIRGSLSLALALWAGPLAAQAPSLTNPLGMEFVLIRPGSLRVGRFQPECPSPPAEDAAPPRRVDPRALWTAEDYRRCEELARRDAMPGFRVRITRPFYIGRYEVTQAEWKRVMGGNPSVFQGARVEGDSDLHPVDNVTWEDAQAFVRRLGELDPSATYRLPTELEWEYAARAGADRDPEWRRMREHAWLQQVDRGTTHPVGRKLPNAWGLHDTLGNVWEWVQDWYNEKLFADPVPPTSGEVHVLRGGGFLSDVKNTSWFVRGAGPGNGFDVGLRVVREATPVAAASAGKLEDPS